MPNWLDVKPHSGVPIYVQVVQQITHAMEVGALQTGDQLPTVRQLASELTIAPNTIVKAYDELARLGLIESRQGVGTVVTANLNGALRQHQIEALFERMRALVRDAANLGVSEQELSERFEAELAHFYRGTQDGQGG
ncbi:MAG TPA: GntR family transcriptional regulator [Ktedonobacterales bacterium]|nr:GntR family transcriptional regulator [Ktedonobacterales bacterium]